MGDQPSISDSIATAVLAIAIIGPDERRRIDMAEALAGFPGAAITEFSAYPADLDDLPRTFKQHFDVVFVDVDSNPDFAFDVVECICAYGNTSVMAYSALADLKVAVRFMRAGAREFLTLPVSRADVAGALARASVRGAGAKPPRKTARKVFVFLGAKGGCGVTTIASNFAVALAQESGQSTLLVDLGLPLGDAAINLGMVAEYSTDSALQNVGRLDANLLSSLLARHSSGLFVLAAPSDLPKNDPPAEAVDKLITVARQNFDYVVVDAGSRVDLKYTSLFEEPAIVYLVTQVGVSELRNANRLIARFFSVRGRSLQIVLNRYTPNALLFDERHIARALTRPAQWRVPDDFASARRTQSTATPLVLDDSPIAAVIRRMARTACGLPPEAERRGGLGFLRDMWPFSRSADEPEPSEEFK